MAGSDLQQQAVAVLTRELGLRLPSAAKSELIGAEAAKCGALLWFRPDGPCKVLRLLEYVHPPPLRFLADLYMSRSTEVLAGSARRETAERLLGREDTKFIEVTAEHTLFGGRVSGFVDPDSFPW